jgi:hypothetical protein
VFRNLYFFAIVAIIAAGCAGRSPIEPGAGNPNLQIVQNALSTEAGLHRLWAEGTLFINAAHDRVEVVPRREGRFHLNALKFLEEYCADCLQVTNIKNNGDSTIDLTVKITHPFPGHAEYTGFDVKGIIMFNGSWTNDGYKWYYPWPDPFRISWRKLGDPQVLNPDGYSERWSPSYDSGLPQPIFNYWHGKYANGTPTANINAFLNFYTTENRHMFTSYGQVSRTYHIWLPKGPVVAGYAVDACWEPPSKTPVIDPATDFPTTANQPEAYSFYFNINNGQPVTDNGCCSASYDPPICYFFVKKWGGHIGESEEVAYFADYHSQLGAYFSACGDEWPDEYGCPTLFNFEVFPDGDYLGVALNARLKIQDWTHVDVSYTVFEFTVDLQ